MSHRDYIDGVRIHAGRVVDPVPEGLGKTRGLVTFEASMTVDKSTMANLLALLPEAPPRLDLDVDGEPFLTDVEVTEVAEDGKLYLRGRPTPAMQAREFIAWLGDQADSWAWTFALEDLARIFALVDGREVREVMP